MRAWLHHQMCDIVDLCCFSKTTQMFSLKHFYFANISVKKRNYYLIVFMLIASFATVILSHCAM